MIVCARCGHENPDGRNLCERCRAYLGWSKPVAAGAPTAATPAPSTPPAAPSSTPPPHHYPTPTATAQGGRQPIAGQRFDPPATPPPPTTWSSTPALTPTRPQPPSAPAARPMPAPIQDNTPRSVVPLSPTAPRQVTVGHITPIPTVISETPARYTPTIPQGRQPTGPTGPSGPSRIDAYRPDDAVGGGRTASPSSTDLNRHGLAVGDAEFEDAIRCPACGRAAAAGSRFCRCGATLRPPVETEEWEDPIERLPWHRRLRDGLGSGARHWRSIRNANQGARAKFGQAESIKNRAAKYLSVLGIAAIGFGMFSPWSSQFRHKVYDTVSNVLPWSYTSLQAAGAIENGTGDPGDPANPDVPGFGAKNAVDLDLGTAWATGWTAPTQNTGTACTRQPGAQRLVITFATPQRIDRLSIVAGLPAGSFDRTLQSRPKTIGVFLSDGSCVQGNLTDTADPQAVAVAGKDITSITISILEVIDGDDIGNAANLVAITEVVPSFR